MIRQFTTTEMCRPELIRRSCESFASNLTGVSLRNSTLWMNLDPLPAGREPAEAVAVARRFFGTVVANVAETPCFPAAFRWAISQPTDEFFLHLELDWVLREPVNVRQMLAIMAAEPRVSVVNLRAYRFGGLHDRICLSPGLWRTDHARQIAQRITLDANPEQQLRPLDERRNPHGDRHLGFVGRQWPDQIVLRDIGREWMATSGCRKEKRIGFTKWVTND